MKYFGQYLVSKGIITEDLLVDALIEQINLLPSMVEIIRKKNLIPTPSLLAAFAHQTEKQIDFKQACVDLGMWNAEVESSVKKELETIRTPLGQLLVKNNVTDIQTITKALDEFLSRAETPQKESIQNTTSSELGQNVINEKKEQVSESIASKKVDSVLMEEFLTSFSDSRIENMKSLFSALKSEADSIQKNTINLKQLFSEFRTLRGLLRMMDFKKTESLVAMSEGLILKTLELAHQKDTHLISVLSDIGQSEVDCLILMRGFIEKSESEEQCYQHIEWNEKILKIHQKISDLFSQENIKGDYL